MSNYAKSHRQHTEGTPVKGHAGVRENEHDPYALQAKLPEPTWCPDCGAVYEHGRWQWKERLAATAPQHRCSACQRIHDDQPAGYLHIEGDSVTTRRDELLRLIEHRAEHARAEHPMQRVMATRDEGAGLLITTTDVHLARALGEALHHAHHGELRIRYSPGDSVVRVYWRG